MTLWGNICHPYFIDEEIESQRGCLLTKDTQLGKRRACIQIQAVWLRVHILTSALKRLFRAWWHEVSGGHGIPRGTWFPVGHYFTLVPSCPIRKVLDHRDKVYEQLSKYLQLRNVIERLQVKMPRLATPFVDKGGAWEQVFQTKTCQLTSKLTTNPYHFFPGPTGS